MIRILSDDFVPSKIISLSHSINRVLLNDIKIPNTCSTID